MTPLSGFILSKKSFDLPGKSPEIHIWVKTDEGPCQLIINQQKPVFFIRQSDRLQSIYALNKDHLQYEYTPLALKSFAQEPAAGLYFNSLSDYQQARQTLKSSGILVYEADIQLHDRYLMERFCYGSIEFIGKPDHEDTHKKLVSVKIKPGESIPKFSLLSLDIECSLDASLFSIGLYDGSCKKVIMIGEPQNSTTEVIWVESEVELLKTLVSEIHCLDPDIIIGWNIINFDIRILLQRSEELGIQLSIGRDHSTPVFRESRDENLQDHLYIAGRVVIDGINALRSATYSFASFSLDYVARELLGEGKLVEDVENRVEAIEYNFLHNKPALAAYNLEDCRLVFEIFRKTDLINFMAFRSQITGLDLNRQGGSVAAFTNLYLPLMHRQGYIAPNLPAHGGLASPGGYVMDSRPGLYNNVLVLDYKSLYPSIILTFKIDPVGLIEGLQELDRLPDDIPDSMDEKEFYKAIIPGYKGAVFSRKIHFLPDLIKRLWQERDIAKKNNDDARSQAIKIMMNSFYGVLGSGGCRFYDPRLSSSITLRGHSIIQQTQSWLEDLGYPVIYGDTDSIFILLDQEMHHEDACRIGRQLAREINENWQEKLREEFDLESFLEIEFETHFSKFFMPTIRGSEQGSKKRYAGIKLNGNQSDLVFKGLESVRTDWTQLARDFQKTLYSLIFEGKNPAKFIKAYVEDTLAGKYDQALIYRKRLRQPLSSYQRNIPPHAKAARIVDITLENQGKAPRYQRPGWINYVITTKGPEPCEFQQYPLDYQHYIDKQLAPVADAILPFVGLDFSELIDIQDSLF